MAGKNVVFSNALKKQGFLERLFANHDRKKVHWERTIMHLLLIRLFPQTLVGGLMSLFVFKRL